MKDFKKKTNKSLFQQASRLLVGGVNSPIRSFKYVGGDPLLVKKAKGAYLYDYDGNKYLDYVLAYGALILGHSYPDVIKNLKQTLNSGLSFGATTEKEIELAALIQEAIPFIEKIRFVNSGTEATMSAVRLARGYTGRKKIVKFKGAYHGHGDCFLVKPLGKGVPEEFIKNTLTIAYGDKKTLEKIFLKYGEGIAAVILEPVGGNSGVICPDEEFLKYLRAITLEYKTLLIFDEVITGFRFAWASAAQDFGITPDLICLGKIIGGGLPVGAYGGKEEIMLNLAPLGKVYQASTFAGNPVVMNAGITTIRVLKKIRYRYKEIIQLVEKLTQSIQKHAQFFNQKLTISTYKTMFSFRFKEKETFIKFYRYLLRRGIYFAPSEDEANFISFAHSNFDIKRTTKEIKNALKLLS